jgi:hypothetical protein
VNFDLEGGDLTHFRGSSQQGCESACSADSACVAYSFDKWNGWCFLKSSLGVLRFEPKCVVGVREGAGEPPRATSAKVMQRYRGRSFPGEGYERRRSASMEACEESCRVDSACVAFTFRRSASACQMFDVAPEYHPDGDADSGAKRQPEGG